MKKITVAWMCLYFIGLFFLFAAACSHKEQQLKNRYLKVHPISTDLEIEDYEYIFDIKCDSTCYH